jgi:hypothetical protein
MTSVHTYATQIKPEQATYDAGRLAFLDDVRDLEFFARYFKQASEHPAIVDAVEREKRWRRHKPFVTFVEWLTKLEDPPALPVVAALLSGGPITRQIAKFV